MNSVPARSKQSHVVRLINRCIVLVFICLISLCTASAVINRFQVRLRGGLTLTLTLTLTLPLTLTLTLTLTLILTLALALTLTLTRASSRMV